MELFSALDLPSGFTVAIDRDGREHVVVAIKGSFAIPDDDGQAPMLPVAEQAPLTLADSFWGEPGLSAARYECDFPLTKPRCDALVNGTAYAPQGQPVERLVAGVQLGTWRKLMEVVGDRVWQPAGPTPAPGPANRFTAMPITYDRAFGGIDTSDPTKPDASLTNTIGCGHATVRAGAWIYGRPVPNLEYPGEPVTLPWGNYRPAGLGVVGRGWRPRIGHAGTYDQAWQDNRFPFLPLDFDDRYFQAAAEDQQIDHPVGGELVTLLNLTPDGHRRFRLPTLSVPVSFLPREGPIETVAARLDTVLIEPDLDRVLLTWRASRALPRNIFDVRLIVVGDPPRGWWRAQETGKRWYSRLGEVFAEPPD